eukprot:365832-Chlamydomonas_euryale.AAC.8
MDPYDKLRGSMGFHVDYEKGLAFNTCKETKLKAIYEGCKSYVVNLVCSRGDETGFFNGFFYNDSNLVLTSGHISGWNGADKYEALYFQGTTLERRCELKLLHLGSFVRQEISDTGTPFNVRKGKEGTKAGKGQDETSDVTVLECPDVPSHPPRPYAEQGHPGASVCVVGFKGVEEPQLSICDGVVSYTGLNVMHTGLNVMHTGLNVMHTGLDVMHTGLDVMHTGLNVMHITAHADDGYSGSPVLSTEGYVVGMIKGEVGTTSKQVKVVDVKTIHSFLVSKGLPGFQG